MGIGLISKSEELKSFFQHKDFNLARRRLLDLVYDIDDVALLRKSLVWSKAFSPDENVSDSWISEGLGLLSQLKTFENVKNQNFDLLIHSDNISKTYRNGFFSLNNISLQLQYGEIIGVVGENGNGKTTLLMSIAGFLTTGLDRSNFSYVSEGTPFHYLLKQSTGFIPQRIPRWYGKLIDNLRFSASIHGIYGEKNELMVDFVLERFGLSKFAHLTWKQISSGYRTRFEVARIILQRPAVLILDEPLANLDINAQQTLLQDLRYIAQSALHPMGIILTSQQLFEVEKVADKVLLIQKGKGIYNISESENGQRVFEIESSGNRELIGNVLGNLVSEIRFNGGVYEIYTQAEPNECLDALIRNNISIRYFRDITASTKRFF